MAFRLPEGYVPWRARVQWDGEDRGVAHYIIERPAIDGQPEVIRILDDDIEDHRPAQIFGEEEDNVNDDVSDNVSEEEEEFSSDEDDWSDDSPDSGYSTMTDDEDDPEHSEDDDNRPRSPLPLPPPNFWQEWRQQCRPFPAAAPLAAPTGPTRVLDAAPSTSGLSTSTKRTREERDTEQVGMKRPRRDDEDNPEEPTPSTSGLSTSTKRTREESDTGQVGMKRPRRDDEDNPEEPTPSTSGLSSSAHRDPAPSLPGLPHFTPLGVPGIQLLYLPRRDDDSDSD
ncbi:death domain-associated protein 6-like [Lates calcarifer]|uniref:Death domain-associated protein 6-like n=1 Tax=Lates calcarifer TaxID=8187 RepID=A0AAJ8DT81_LATCA|nr:death domain-associated protein 6-like [Lates calcarifer]